MVDFKEFVIGLLILGGNSAATSLDDEALDFMFRYFEDNVFCILKLFSYWDNAVE